MAAIDTETLFQEISNERPCGEDLEYDPAFIELEAISKGKAEQQIGDTIIEAECADWPQVKKQSLELLSRTKDIRVLIFLIRSILYTDDLTDFKDSLALLKRLLQHYWQQIYPQLDEEDNDPTMRINALSTLCNEEAVLHPLRMAPLVRSRMLGRFSLRDITIATGEAAPPADYEPVEKTTIDAAFMDADSDELQVTFDAVNEAIDCVNEIEGFVTDQVGVTNATSFSELTDVLKEAQQILSDQLARRDIGKDEEEPIAEAADNETPGAAATISTTSCATTSSASSTPSNGQINSREDVIRALEKVEDYYSQHEPASPVPLLISRARKLVHMDFMEIIKNIAPDGISQVEMLCGPEDKGQQGADQQDAEQNDETW